jgi:hypothetical protein
MLLAYLSAVRVRLGDDPHALEQLIVEDTDKHRDAPLAKPFIIPKVNAPTVARELDVAGVTEATVFPDLDGLCSELARRYDRGAL